MSGMPMVELHMASALNQALGEALAADPTVFLLGEDIVDPAGGVMQVTKGLSTKWGRERVRETPISEQAIIGAATGAAMAGMRPVAEIMIMDFIAVAADQLVNHAAKLRFMSGGRTNVPLAREAILASAARTKRAVVVHQAVRRCGFGAEIAALLQEELFGTLEAPVLRVAGKETPVPYAKELEDFHFPQAADIVDAIRT